MKKIALLSLLVFSCVTLQACQQFIIEQENLCAAIIGVNGKRYSSLAPVYVPGMHGSVDSFYSEKQINKNNLDQKKQEIKKQKEKK